MFGCHTIMVLFQLNLLSAGTMICYCYYQTVSVVLLTVSNIEEKKLSLGFWVVDIVILYIHLVSFVMQLWAQNCYCQWHTGILQIARPTDVALGIYLTDHLIWDYPNHQLTFQVWVSELGCKCTEVSKNWLFLSVCENMYSVTIECNNIN